MDPGGAIFFAIVVAVALLAVGIAVFGWDRYHGEKPPVGSDPGMRPTTEVFIDPVTHRRQRVWSNPATGQREYRDE